MLYVKIMSDEDLPDTDPYKNYSILTVPNTASVKFRKNPDWELGSSYPRFLLQIWAENGDVETHELTGNAYVMTESGKTIASHGA